MSSSMAASAVLHDDFFGNAPEVLPPRVHAFFKRIAAEDLREGMENVYAFVKHVAKKTPWQNLNANYFIGTITKIEFNENTVAISAYTNTENQIISDHDFRLNTEEEDYGIFHATEFYQEYVWVRQPLTVATDLKVFRNQVIRFDILPDNFEKSETDYITTNVIHLKNEDAVVNRWAQVMMEEACAFPESKALYLLTPTVAKLQRKPESIPPMPGQKPIPGPDPKQGDDKDDERKDPEIPPMPGMGGSQTDKNKRTDNKSELNRHWWGTSQKEGK